MTKVHQTPNIKWTDEEMILSLAFYVFIYRKNKNQKMITIFWSDLIKYTQNERTIGSINMRMSNFAYIDPLVKKGYAGGAPRCSKYWNDYLVNNCPTQNLVNIFSDFINKYAANPEIYEKYIDLSNKQTSLYTPLFSVTMDKIENESSNEHYLDVVKNICKKSAELVNCELDEIDPDSLINIIINSYKLGIMKHVDLNELINELYQKN